MLLNFAIVEVTILSGGSVGAWRSIPRRLPRLRHLLLVHRMARGFSSWILAFETQPDDPLSTLLSRAAYPESVISTEGGRAAVARHRRSWGLRTFP